MPDASLRLGPSIHACHFVHHARPRSFTLSSLSSDDQSNRVRFGRCDASANKRVSNEANKPKARSKEG